jgi:hypothetical protein
MQGAEGSAAPVAEQAQPRGELRHAAAEQVRDLDAGLAGGDPEHGREAFVDAPVVGLVAAAFDFLRLFPVKVNRLHLAPSWASPSPPRRAITVAFLWGV